MRFLRCVFLLFPLTAAAQLPLPVLPDWLRPSQSAAQVLNSTHVTLTENNYRLIQTNVIGRSRGFKLFGLISIRPASYTQAMSQLYDKAHVEPGKPQALANVIHESGSTYLILFSLPRVTIRADLIEFTGEMKAKTAALRTQDDAFKNQLEAAVQ